VPWSFKVSDAQRELKSMHINQNDPEFQFVQGEFAYRYCGDLTDAKNRLTFAARRGHARAQHLLGSIYKEEGQYRQAARWYRLAAWQGRLPAAANSLGLLYLHGLGVKRDLVQAERWLRQAALGADTNAMTALANLCEKPEAYAWYRLAVQRKSSEAAEALRELMPSMSVEEIVEGKRFVLGLRKQIKRPAARKQRVETSAKVYVGSQDLIGDMCEWRVDYWVQRSGIDWILHLKGEGGGVEKIGPLEARDLLVDMEDRGLDVGEFTAQVQSSRLPMLIKLGQEIGAPQG
jgi:TPR repeat protein